MSGNTIRKSIPVVLFLCALGYVVFRCLGCTPAEQQAAVLSAENALAVKQYDEALEECFQAARRKPEAVRFEAFKDCELATIKAYCEASESLREHWPRCKGGQ
jgi:hypothetical protein